MTATALVCGGGNSKDRTHALLVVPALPGPRGWRAWDSVCVMWGDPCLYHTALTGNAYNTPGTTMLVSQCEAGVSLFEKENRSLSPASSMSGRLM